MAEKGWTWILGAAFLASRVDYALWGRSLELSAIVSVWVTAQSDTRKSLSATSDLPNLFCFVKIN